MSAGLSILHLALIFFSVYSLGRKWNTASDKLFWAAFLVRLISGITLGLVYTYYYSAGDTWLFFEDAKKLTAIARQDFFSYLNAIFDFGKNQNLPGLMNDDLRAIFFIKIISVFCLISNDSYWICAAYFSLLSFIISWSLHRTVINILPDASIPSALAFLFFPSVVFWSSGLEKESVALAGIYFLVIGFLKIIYGEKPAKLFWLLVIPVGYIVWGLKYYWAIIFFVSIFTGLVIRVLVTKSFLVNKYLKLTWVILFSGIGVVLSFTHPNFYLDQFLKVIVSNYNDFAAISSSKNLIHYYQLDPAWLSIMINSPWALLSGLFRPFIGEGQGLPGWIASAENLLLLVLFAGALTNLRRRIATLHQISFLAALSFCIVLCVFLALSTPNFGTLSRYRVGFLPFFVFVIAYCNPIVEWIFKKKSD